MSEEQNLSPQRLTERQVRVETQVLNLSESVGRMGQKLQDVDDTLQSIGNVLASLSARPEAKGFGEQIRTVSTTASVLVALAGAIWWSISISSAPIQKELNIVSKELISESKANREARIHLEYLRQEVDDLRLFRRGLLTNRPSPVITNPTVIKTPAADPYGVR